MLHADVVFMLPEKTILGHTPLHFACNKGLLGLASTLIRHGADLRTEDADGATPLSLIPLEGISLIYFYA